MSEYPFEAEWAKRQSEPMPDFGVDWTQRSPLAIDQLPELKRNEKQLFERKEKECFSTETQKK